MVGLEAAGGLYLGRHAYQGRRFHRKVASNVWTGNKDGFVMSARPLLWCVDFNCVCPDPFDEAGDRLSIFCVGGI